MQRQRKNYKSDFVAAVQLRDCGGNAVPFPDCDWEMRFYTASKANAYLASHKGGAYTNCFKGDDGRIYFVFKAHRLGCGILNSELHVELPNNIFPGNIQDLYHPDPLGIELVPGKGDCGLVDAEALLPYIKFQYEDLTPEQKAELQAPATEAAGRLDSFVSVAEKAETQRVENEKERATGEETREANEAERIAHEEVRINNESKREEAEKNRVEEFASQQEEINSKANRSELSNVFAREPLTPDNFPGINTYTREELKKDLFVDMFNSAASFGYKDGPCGKYDPDNAPDSEHPFFLNDLWLSYEEALLSFEYWSPVKSVDISCRFHDAKLKTTFFMPVQSIVSCRCYNAFRNCINMESAAFTVMTNDITSMFYNCPKFKKLIGHISIGADNAGVAEAFKGCYELEEILIYYVRGNISFSDSPKLSLKSLNHLVVNRRGTNSFTVTVHPDVYAKLTDETNTEWHALLALAAEKNITFATT